MIFDDRYDSKFKTPLKRMFTLTTFPSAVGQVGKTCFSVSLKNKQNDKRYLNDEGMWWLLDSVAPAIHIIRDEPRYMLCGLFACYVLSIETLEEDGVGRRLKVSF